MEEGKRLSIICSCLLVVLPSQRQKSSFLSIKKHSYQLVKVVAANWWVEIANDYTESMFSQIELSSSSCFI